MTKRCCENCHYWMTPDPTLRIGNRGMCSALTSRGYDAKSNPVGPAIKAPFWTTELARITISWEGGHCPTFKPVSGR